MAVGVRLTPEEIRALKQQAKRQGVPRYTALIRDAVTVMLSRRGEGDDE